MTSFSRRSFLRATAAWCVPITREDAGDGFAFHEEELPREIGARVEMFVDGWLIQRMQGLERRLAAPERREIVLVTDRPWEGPDSAYFTVIKDGGNIRLYYRGFCPADADDKQVTCLAESRDGVHFDRQRLGLFTFAGSRENNIVWTGVESHNFAPFLDENPAASANGRYKALGGISGKLYGFVSPDGIRWRKIQTEPVMTRGAFDSLNTAFWDTLARYYRCYSRYFDGQVRAIQSCTSQDFRTWTDPRPNVYPPGSPREHFYTNATRPCPGAPHMLLSFPKRFMPSRTRLPGHKEPGVSDAVFLSSRDGLHWDRSFTEAWLKPGLDERNWTQRSNMPAAGIVDAGDEFVMYASEHYQWPDNRLRRLAVRRHGFASIHAGASGGEFLTYPLRFSGSSLHLNFATSAAGSVLVEVQDQSGQPIQGLTASDMRPLFGDSLHETVHWSGGRDLATLIGKVVRFRFQLNDADLYALQTT